MKRNMTPRELEDEINETKLTIRHLSMIGEERTAHLVVAYLGSLLDERTKMPRLHVVH
jgi:hypothetical protein